MKDGVITLGEALIDFIPVDQRNESYLKSPGGAPANVSVGIARLGAKSTFIGKVGNDQLGHFLVETLRENEVDTTYMSFTEEVKTGFTLVTNKDDGDREFEFYIQPSADSLLKKEDISSAPFLTSKIFHFGTISLIDQPVKDATLHAVKLAKQNDMIISFDPNIRLPLWHSKQTARETVLAMLEDVDVLKLSEEELELITKTESLEEGISRLEKYQIPFIIVTHGAEGSYVITKNSKTHVSAMDVTAVDTTGAGDAFVSGILYCLNKSDSNLNDITLKQASEYAQFASISAGLTVTTKGAMSALPTLDKVEKKLREANGN